MDKNISCAIRNYCTNGEVVELDPIFFVSCKIRKFAPTKTFPLDTLYIRCLDMIRKCNEKYYFLHIDISLT